MAVGEVVEGNVGSASHKLDYTYIGNIVNVAARLEHATRRYSVPLLLTDKVNELLEGSRSSDLVIPKTKLIGSVEMHNMEEKVEVYCPVELADSEFGSCKQKILEWKEKYLNQLL